MLDIRVLGAGGGMPMPGKYLSSIIINYNGNKILVDCGEGSQVAMKEYNTGFKDIDLILITHVHGDHINGLFGLLSTLGNCGRTEKIVIIGPNGINEVFQAIKILVPYIPYEIEVIEVIEDKFRYKYKEILINTIKLDHSCDCLGYNFNLNRVPKFIKEKAENLKIPNRYWGLLQKGNKIEIEGRIIMPEQVLGEERQGLKLSYITDTRPLEKICEFIKGSDLFFCEANYESNEKLDKAIINKHMTYEEAATLALQSNCKKLMLIHFSPSIEQPEEFLDNAKNIFQDSYISKQGELIKLKYK